MVAVDRFGDVVRQNLPGRVPDDGPLDAPRRPVGRGRPGRPGRPRGQRDPPPAPGRRARPHPAARPRPRGPRHRPGRARAAAERRGRRGAAGVPRLVARDRAPAPGLPGRHGRRGHRVARRRRRRRGRPAPPLHRACSPTHVHVPVDRDGDGRLDAVEDHRPGGARPSPRTATGTGAEPWAAARRTGCSRRCRDACARCTRTPTSSPRSGASMQRISRRIRRQLVEGSTAMWTGPGADEARAAFLALAAETETRGRTFEEAATADAGGRPGDHPQPRGVRHPARPVGRAGQPRSGRRRRLPGPRVDGRLGAGAAGGAGAGAGEGVGPALPAVQREHDRGRRRPRPHPPRPTAPRRSRSTPRSRPWSPGAYTPPPADGWRPGVVGGAPDGPTGGVLVGTSAVGGTTDVGWGGTGDGVPDLVARPTTTRAPAPRPDDERCRRR